MSLNKCFIYNSGEAAECGIGPPLPLPLPLQPHHTIKLYNHIITINLFKINLSNEFLN